MFIQIFDTETKGKGVRATRLLLKGELVVEYTGELVSSLAEHEKRELKYSLDKIEGGHQFQARIDEKNFWFVVLN